VKLFSIQLKAGLPIFEQVLYAARKAIVAGDLQPGDPFPSVRAISAEYRINPNTVQKAIVELKRQGLVETVPGIGNRVRERPAANREDRAVLMGAELEAIVIRAKQLHLTEEELNAAINKHWKKL
jgi:GntR family transcriptional regulator